MPAERVCCVWCPSWPVVAARARDPELIGRPLVVVGHGERSHVVRAVSREACEEGVTVGLRRREAEARCAGLVVLDADESADARAFERVVRSVEQLVPRLVLDRPGRLWFPTRGPSRYFGGDDALAQRVQAGAGGALGVVDVPVHVGVADGELAAALAAREPRRVVPPGESPAFLADWDVGVVAARVDDGDDLVGLLRRLGVRSLGDLAALPAPAVLARFGAAGVQAHQLAGGAAVAARAPAIPPPELVETMELDPPAFRVDEVAFAAKALADRLLGRLAELGLCSTRVVIEAETEHGEQLTRCWRHDGALTPTAVMARVRWQLEAWLVRDDGARLDEVGADDATGGLVVLRLMPDEVVPATGRQLGFWGGDAAAADRVDRALARVQGMLGHEAVVSPVRTGGRGPREQIRWVPWGEPQGDDQPDAPWPGSMPGPAPARVFDPPLPAELLDADGRPVGVSGRGEASAPPVVLRCAGLPEGGGSLVGWAGPWAHDLRWWDRRARGARWQVVVGTAGADEVGVACLVVSTRGRTGVEAIYD